ncbi:hypothetical protein ANANG_G00108310 [Anguilla anguilla]|uniref:Uncharacterized protein n=1 Tax=Anguilla anguilla TaxID=7936 RepID=A0A9D3RZ93_ANGAN|nr:hypothetical protein ANANG_G00108310 [Anguilla anguilla]
MTSQAAQDSTPPPPLTFSSSKMQTTVHKRTCLHLHHVGLEEARARGCFCSLTWGGIGQADKRNCEHWRLFSSESSQDPTVATQTGFFPDCPGASQLLLPLPLLLLLESTYFPSLSRNCCFGLERIQLSIVTLETTHVTETTETKTLSVTPRTRPPPWRQA